MYKITEQRKEQLRAYNKERYNWLKEHHICVNCGHEKAELGTIYCLVCREDLKIRQRGYYHKKAKNKEYLEKEAKRRKALYYKAKAEHKCVKCGRKLRENNTTTMCSICKNKSRNLKDGYTRGERPNYGRCYVCGKHELYSDKLCRECYQRTKNTIKKANENPTSSMIIARTEYRKTFQIFFLNNKKYKNKARV